MRISILTCLTCLILVSCSNNGTYKYVDDPKKFVSTKTVAVGRHRYNDLALAAYDSIAVPFDTTIVNGLNRSKIFEHLIPRGADTSMDSANAKNADALLFCDLLLEKRKVITALFIEVGTAWGATVTLTLISKADSSRIMYARYNANFFAEDQKPNDIQTATVAGAAGAVRMFLRSYADSR
jgi:hypothetical protein